MPKVINTNIWKENMIVKHNGEYDYSESVYTKWDEKVRIICHKKDENGIEHGVFLQRANNHSNGQGCPKCALEMNKIDLKEFEQRCKEKFDIEYKTINFEYKNKKKYVNLICPVHGEIMVRMDRFLNNGCPKCNRNILTTEDFIEKSNNVQNNKYSYSKTIYKSLHEKVIITCPIHGDFLQTPYTHLIGHGCKECIKEELSLRFRSNKDEFIFKSRKIHKDGYDYSEVEYINAYTKVCIICNKCGYKFWQKPTKHLSGYGCSSCKQSKLEIDVKNILEENNINFEVERTFDWLKNKRTLRLDFYLPEYNIAIECQGKQHFIPVNYFGGEKQLENTIECDKVKLELCKEHNIPIIYYNYNDKNLEKLISNIYEYDKVLI